MLKWSKILVVGLLLGAPMISGCYYLSAEGEYNRKYSGGWGETSTCQYDSSPIMLFEYYQVELRSCHIGSVSKRNGRSILEPSNCILSDSLKWDSSFTQLDDFSIQLSKIDKDNIILYEAGKPDLHLTRCLGHEEG